MDKIQELIDLVDYVAMYHGEEGEKRLRALSAALTECGEEFEKLYLAKLEKEARPKSGVIEK